MKPDHPPHKSCIPPYPQTWCQVYSVISSLLIGFLALSFLLDALKRALP